LSSILRPFQAPFLRHVRQSIVGPAIRAGYGGA